MEWTSSSLCREGRSGAMGARNNSLQSGGISRPPLRPKCKSMQFPRLELHTHKFSPIITTTIELIEKLPLQLMQ